MPAKKGPSEFGGLPQRNGVQPRPHVPTRSEALSLGYRTGDETGRTQTDTEGVAFEGLLPKKDQTAARKAAGDLEKGQIWDELVQKGEQDV